MRQKSQDPSPLVPSLWVRIPSSINEGPRWRPHRTVLNLPPSMSKHKYTRAVTPERQLRADRTASDEQTRKRNQLEKAGKLQEPSRSCGSSPGERSWWNPVFVPRPTSVKLCCGPPAGGLHQLHCLEPFASKGNKQAQQGVSRPTWLSYREPFHPDNPMPLSTCPVPTSFQDYLAHRPTQRSLLHKTTFSTTNQRDYREGWGAAGALWGQRGQLGPLFLSPCPSTGRVKGLSKCSDPPARLLQRVLRHTVPEHCGPGQREQGRSRP